LASSLSPGNVNPETNLMQKLNNSRKRSDFVFFRKLILWIVYILQLFTSMQIKCIAYLHLKYLTWIFWQQGFHKIWQWLLLHPFGSLAI
jgi:hypothetical protein